MDGSVEQLLFTFEYVELMQRLGFNTEIDKLVNVGIDSDGDMEILIHGLIVDTDDLPVAYGFKTGYIDEDEILELLEEDHETIDLDDEEYEYEFAYAATDLCKQQVIVRIQKTYIEE